MCIEFECLFEYLCSPSQFRENHAILLFKSTVKNFKFYFKRVIEKESKEYLKFHIHRVDMPTKKIFEFTTVVRGVHYYRRCSVPKPSQKLNCFYQPDNSFDEFTIKVCEEGHEVPVGYLPREISPATKFFIDRIANTTVTFKSDHYRRSPLVQAGMEITCKVTASIPGTCINLLLMER